MDPFFISPASGVENISADYLEIKLSLGYRHTDRLDKNFLGVIDSRSLRTRNS